MEEARDEWIPICENCGALEPFATDGCSHWPDTFWGIDYTDCCLGHDIAYWQGGCLELKDKADRELYERIKSKAGVFWGWIMWFGVSQFGIGAIGTRARWGSGHKWPCYGDGLVTDLSEHFDDKPD